MIESWLGSSYRYWGLGGINRGDASDEELKADAERHGLVFDPDNIST